MRFTDEEIKQQEEESKLVEKAEKDSNNLWKIRWEKFKFDNRDTPKEIATFIVLTLAGTIFLGLMFAPAIIGIGTR